MPKSEPKSSGSPEGLAPLSEQEVLDIIGDPQEVDRALTAFRKSARKLSSRQSKMVERYPQEWVAIHAGRVRAHGASMESVLNEIDKKGLTRSETILRFIEVEPRTLIL